MVNSGKSKGKKGGNRKRKGSDSQSTPEPKKALAPKSGVVKGDCHHCKQPGHWRRNCAIYLKWLKEKKETKGKGNIPSTSCIFVIEVNLSTSSSWVLDTACGSTFVLMCRTAKEWIVG